jgi:phage gpG-like protein
MAKVKVTSRFDILTELKRLKGDALGRELGPAVIKELKDFVSKGVSPIEGERRFERYKDPTTYPGGEKNRVPVNLKLTGEMLNSITWKPIEGGVLIEAKDPKAIYHHTGTANMAARPFIPMMPGQTFNQSITRTIRAIYNKAISAIIKKASR